MRNRDKARHLITGRANKQFLNKSRLRSIHFCKLINGTSLTGAALVPPAILSGLGKRPSFPPGSGADLKKSGTSVHPQIFNREPRARPRISPRTKIKAAEGGMEIVRNYARITFLSSGARTVSDPLGPAGRRERREAHRGQNEHRETRASERSR